MTNLSRSKCNELAFVIIYDCLIYKNLKLDFDIVDIISSISELSYEETPLFIKEVVLRYLTNEDTLKEKIESKLVRWKWERLSLVNRAILLFSLSSYYYVKEIEKPSIIDVSVKLAKKYGDDKDYRFINGILDNIL